MITMWISFVIIAAIEADASALCLLIVPFSVALDTAIIKRKLANDKEDQWG